MTPSEGAAREVRLTLPAEVLDEFGGSAHRLSDEVREALVVDLFRRRKLSTGRAAAILGLRRDDFAQVLSRHRVPYFDYDEGELSEEIDSADAFLRKA